MFSVLELGVEDTPVSDALEVDSLVVSPLADDVSEEDAAVDGAVDRFVEAESSAESLAAGCSVAGLPEESSLDGSPADALSAESSVSALLDADPLDDESSFDSVSLGVSSSPEALAAPFLTPVPVRRPATSDDRLAVSTCTRADFSPADVGANRIRTICDPLELRSNGASPPTTVNSSASGPTIVRSVTSRGRLTGFSVVIPRVRAEPTATSPKSTVRARAGAVLATRPPVPAAATTVAPST
jgi:hypothetical protein